jgi:hypothetical protein
LGFELKKESNKKKKREVARRIMSLKAEIHPTNVEWAPPLRILESLNLYNPPNSLGNPPFFVDYYLWVLTRTAVYF